MSNEQFARELEGAINRHCVENGSNTPDFILTHYLLDCLASWERAVKAREQWYGRKAEAEQVAP